MTASWETSLPPSLQNSDDLAMIRKLVTQWSRLVAWSWTSIIASGNKKEENVLKKFFNDTLQQQGLNTRSYESYSDLDSQAQADTLSKYLKSLFLGNNSDIPFLADEGVKVTLSEVLEALSGEKFVFTEFPDFTEMFICRATADYTGKVTEISTNPRQYVATLTYPPRPALSKYTVEEEQLEDWAENKNTGGNYLPPSLYIPIAGT